MKKFNWNYNSNHIEGNTLTYGQTKLLLFFGRHEGGHLERNYTEMKAHDVAIKKIEELSKDKKRPLTEIDIRDINEIILKEPFWKRAQTPDGQPTQKKIIPGAYKTESNHVKTVTGKIFKFAEPWEVPQKMADLIQWFNKKITSPLPSITSFIAELHHRFILIHPFDDGNGRTARLWINYTLLYLGYPPLVIKSDDKENYLTALNKTDVGDMNSFPVYLGKILVAWLEICIKGAKGEDITESSDIDKEVDLYIQEQKNKNLDAPVAFSEKTMRKMYDNFLEPFLNTFEKKLFPFVTLFERNNVTLEIHPQASLRSLILKKQTPIYKNFSQMYMKDKRVLRCKTLIHIENLSRICTSIKEDIIDNKSHWTYFLNTEILCEICFNDFKVKREEPTAVPFDMKIVISLIYSKYDYEIKIIIKNKKSGALPLDLITEEKITKKEKYYSLWGEAKINDFVAEIKSKFFSLLKTD